MLGVVTGGERELSAQECWALLARGWLGRVALTANALPIVVPVEYCVTGDELALCLGRHDIPARRLVDAVVGFATDFVDDATREGWTVHVQGTTRLADAHVTCATHEQAQIVFLVPAVVTGQTLQLCPFGRDLLTGPAQ